MNKIVREHIIKNQREMKLAFDEKVTPYSYCVGGVVLLNDPVEKVGVSGKLRRVWCGPYQITFLSSTNCRLMHTTTGKCINGLVHINRIKPYFYRDELPDDLEDTGKELTLGEALVPGVVEREAPAPKKFKTKAAKRPRAQARAGSDPGQMEELLQNEQVRAKKPAEIDEDNEVPDPETVYEAQGIVKQRRRKGGKRQFLVKWAEETYPDSWCDECDVSDALLAHWFIAHNQKGLKRKKLNVSLVSMSKLWACRRWKEEETPTRVERVDECGNEL